MEALIALLIVLVGLVGLDLAAVTWGIDKLVRWSLLPRGDEPIMWDFGSAARHHRIYCPWLGERSRAGMHLMFDVLASISCAPRSKSRTTFCRPPGSARAGKAGPWAPYFPTSRALLSRLIGKLVPTENGSRHEDFSRSRAAEGS